MINLKITNEKERIFYKTIDWFDQIHVNKYNKYNNEFIKDMTMKLSTSGG